jgi:hypothetical protein
MPLGRGSARAASRFQLISHTKHLPKEFPELDCSRLHGGYGAVLSGFYLFRMKLCTGHATYDSLSRSKRIKEKSWSNSSFLPSQLWQLPY